MTIKNVLIIIGLIFMSAPATSQSIDSLRSLLPVKEGIEKADILFQLGRAYFNTNNDSLAASYGQEGYQIARELKDTLMIIKTRRIIASALRRIGHLDSAIRILESLLHLSWKKAYMKER